MHYTLKHAMMLALGLILGIGTMAFTDILHPVSPFHPESQVLDTHDKLPVTMGWVDQTYGFGTKNPTGLLEVRWYCAYEGMKGFNPRQINAKMFEPMVFIERPVRTPGADLEAFYYELTRVQTAACPVFRFNEHYPEK